jgi:hypothetical protein
MGLMAGYSRMHARMQPPIHPVPRCTQWKTAALPRHIHSWRLPPVPGPTSAVAARMCAAAATIEHAGPVAAATELPLPPCG